MLGLGIVIQNRGVEHFKCDQPKISYSVQMDYSLVPVVQHVALFNFRKEAIFTWYSLQVRA